MPFARSPEDLPDLGTVRGLTGLEFMQEMKAGRLTAPPIGEGMNYTLDEVEEGRVIFRGTPLFQHTNPMGGLHGGWYGTLLDSCMACAVMTRLPKGFGYTTLEYKVNLTRALKPGTEIRAVGWTSHVGRSTGVASGEIRGVEDDRLYATGSTTCLVMALPEA